MFFRRYKSCTFRWKKPKFCRINRGAKRRKRTLLLYHKKRWGYWSRENYFFQMHKEKICTPDHKFMLRDGFYKEAQSLKKTDSLMPLHKRLSKIGGRITIDGYEMVWDQNKTWIFTHLLSDEYNLKNKIYEKEQGDHKHHIDFNKLNNNPSNIVRLTKERHLITHTENLQKTLHRQDIKEKAAQAHKTPEYSAKMINCASQPEVQRMLSNKAK